MSSPLPFNINIHMKKNKTKQKTNQGIENVDRSRRSQFFVVKCNMISKQEIVHRVNEIKRKSNVRIQYMNEKTGSIEINI